MTHPLPSAPSMSIDVESEQALIDFDRLWRIGPRPDLARYIAGLGDIATPTFIAALAKIDLQNRFEHGEVGEARAYLDQFSILAEDGERALSLIYEEFCLLADAGAAPDPGSFCDRYATWGDSLASQLEYHRVLSVAVGAQKPTKFPKPGERFRKFDLDSVLGQGGSAKVYLARDASLGGRKFVLKVSQNRGAEPSILGKLTHRNIVPVHSVEVEAESGLRGLCMPYLPGVSLDDLLRRISRGKLPRNARQLWALMTAGAEGLEGFDNATAWPGYPIGKTYADGVAWIILKIAEALAYAHEAKVLHRDVKPANIWLSYEQGPLLLDFNLAHSQSGAEEAEVALRGGTLPYMAPEQIRAFLAPDRWDQVGPQADLYALGLMLREMLSGQAPERPNSRLPLPRALQEMIDRRALPLTSIRDENPNVPHSLAAITQGCLEFQPKLRYPSAQALADDLSSYLERERIRIVPNPSRRESISNWLARKQRGRKAAFALAIIVPLLLFMSTYGSDYIQFRQGVDLLHAKRFDEAEAKLKPLYEASPHSVRLQICYGTVLVNLNRDRQADILFNEAVKSPDSIPILLEELKHDPTSHTLEMALGAAYMAGRSFDDALACYQRILSRDPSDRYALQGKLNVYNETENLVLALDTIQAIFDLFHEQQSAKPDARSSKIGVDELYQFLLNERGLLKLFTDKGNLAGADQACERYRGLLIRIEREGNQTPEHDLFFKLCAVVFDLEQSLIADLKKDPIRAKALQERASSAYQQIRTRKPQNPNLQKLMLKLAQDLGLSKK